ncbi:hypothetical protein B0H13DRAFT_1885579 [Mycena leptocephala]|nr:hypothetical protein B0H13DRAFT_1885579 [Mycena leptocephala]
MPSDENEPASESAVPKVENYLNQLDAMAAASLSQYRASGRIQSLEDAIQHGGTVVKLTTKEHPDYPGRQMSLAITLMERDDRWGNRADLDGGIGLLQETVELLGDDHPNRPWLLQPLGTALDLEYAVENFRDGMKLLPEGSEHRLTFDQSLAICFIARYREMGEMADLDAAIAHSQPEGHLYRCKRLQSLAIALLDRYERLGWIEDFTQRRRCPTPAIPTSLNICRVLQSAAWRDTIDSMTWRHWTVQCTTTKMRWMLLSKIIPASPEDSIAWRSHSQNDITERTILMTWTAIGLVPTEHPDLPLYLMTLATSHEFKYMRVDNLNELEKQIRSIQLADLDDLESAILHSQEGVTLTPAGSPDISAHVLIMAQCYRLRLGDMKDLQAAVQNAEEALRATPHGHVHRSYGLHNLAQALKVQYKSSRNINHLYTSIPHSQAAVNLTPTMHPDLPMHLQGLADSFLELHEISQDISDLDTASLDYKNSFKISAAIPIGSCSGEKHRSAYALDAYSTVFELLPQILWIGNPLGVRRTEARRYDLARITSDAVCGCIENSNLILGVELLEQGLATTFQQMLELKPDVTMLSEADATRLQHLSTELYTDHTEHPRKLANESDKLLLEIRKHPGCEYSKYFTSFIPSPINPSVDMPTPGLSTELRRATRIQRGMKSIAVGRGKMGYIVKTSRIYRKLERIGEEEETRRRTEKEEEESSRGNAAANGELYPNSVSAICTTFAMGGYGGALVAASESDIFTHSYTSTLGSLLYSRWKVTAEEMPEITVVGVTHSGPGRAAALPGVQIEQLDKSSWVHLACHGKQDQFYPPQSLQLYGGT